MPQSPQSRPLDALAVTVMLVLCLTWGFNQVAIKLAIHDIPPLIQAVVRSIIAALLVAAYAKLRGQPLFERDGTLLPGIAAGALFALEFLLIYRGLIWTTATRAVLFIYLAPFFVVIGSRWFIPGDHFHPSQWIGLVLSFVGMVIAFGLPTPASDPHQILGDIMMVGAAAAWGATTLVIKASALNRISSEKTMLYQLVVSTPLLAVAALVFGEHVDAMPSPLALGAVAYQAVWVVSVTYRRLVRAGHPLFRQQIVGLHLPDAAVRRRRRASGPGRAVDRALCVGGGVRGAGAGPRKPAALGLYRGGETLQRPCFGFAKLHLTYCKD